VHGNCFTNIQRLGRWVGGTTVVPSGTDPSPYFRPVTPASLGGGPTPPSIYVLAHGWAPGYRDAVNAQGGDLLWWGPDASANGVWASDWAWSPATAPLTPPFPINPTGVLPEVYESEAYTHVNGMRLANALQEAIAPSFWTMPTGILRLIGHSHGSRVATVAAMTLQHAGRRVAHLTILDAPESEATLEVNGANLLGFYLEQMQIADPSYDCAGGAFVDNYASFFGVGYAGTPNLASVVEVALDPSKLYGPLDSNRHSYAATWYGGAARGAASQGEPALGLAWPPPPADYLPALNQKWPTGTNQASQWNLQPGTSIQDTFSYTTQPLAVTTTHTQGNVRGDPSTTLILGPTAGPAFSSFKGSYYNAWDGEGYGLALDLVWTAPQDGDYLVVTMESRGVGWQETLLVMDGRSAAAGKTSVAITSSAGSIWSLPIYVFFLAAKGNTIGQVALSNFRLVEVRSASGNLRTRRLAAAAEASAQRAATAPALLVTPTASRPG
jgi:hypothetical protein